MVAQLIQNEMGVYEYREVDTRPKRTVAPNLQDFEAYEGRGQKTELVSDPTISEQTEKIIRETPGKYKTVFDEKTGQFTTKEISPITEKEITYDPGAITPESTDPTALQKVMRMTEGTRVETPDYSKIMKETLAAQAKALRPTITEQLIGAGKDIAISYMTQRVLGGTMGGQLAAGGMMTNPYVAAGNLLLQSGVGEDVAKGVGKVAEKAVGAVKKTAKSVWKAVTGGSVICSELCRQNLISKEDYKIHWDYTMNKWTKDELKGYWIWAMPIAKKMKTNKWLTKFWLHIMKYKIQHVKYTLGKAKFTLKGYIYNSLIEQISLLISKCIIEKKTKEVLV